MKTPSAGKRIMMGVIALVLLLGVLRHITGTESPSSVPATVNVTGRFAGYTNNLGQVEALFELKTSEDVLITMPFAYRYVTDEETFKPVFCDEPSWFQYEPWGRTFAVSVASTSEQVRATFNVQARAKGGTRVLERALELYEKWFGYAGQYYSGAETQISVDSGNPDEASTK
jgi:hypothetical protein